MCGNSPWAVPIRVSGEVGTQRLLRLPTLEGCVLPVHDAVLRNLGDTRMLMLNVWQAAKQRRVVTRGSKSGAGGLCVVSKDIKSMQAGLVRWSTSELTSRYDALGIRYTSLEHCPRSATEYFSRCGLRLPTATDGLVLPDWVLGEKRRDEQSTPESDLQPGAALSNVPLPAENHGGTVELAAPIVKKKEIRGADYLDFMRPASLKAGWFSVARIEYQVGTTSQTWVGEDGGTLVCQQQGGPDDTGDGHPVEGWQMVGWGGQASDEMRGLLEDFNPQVNDMQT